MRTEEILIVGSDKIFLDAYLARRGFGVRRATDGAEALKMARKTKPDVSLLDTMLPGESGIRVCQRIRGEEYGARRKRNIYPSIEARPGQLKRPSKTRYAEVVRLRRSSHP